MNIFYTLTSNIIVLYYSYLIHYQNVLHVLYMCDTHVLNV